MDCINIFFNFAVVKNKTLSTFLVLSSGKTYNGNKHENGWQCSNAMIFGSLIKTWGIAKHTSSAAGAYIQKKSLGTLPSFLIRYLILTYKHKAKFVKQS